MLKWIIRTVSGLALILLCIGFTSRLAETIVTVDYKEGAPYYFILGCTAYLAVHILFRRPILTYVFGHELTHALFTVLFGGSVKSFHASERGGRVAITKSNFIITLAPYFFPIYTFGALVLYGAARAADVKNADAWIIVLAGATYAFHIMLTFVFLRTDQDDIKEHGAFFSYPLIYLFNVLFFALIMRVLIARNMSFIVFLRDGIIDTIDVTASLFGMAYSILRSQL